MGVVQVPKIALVSFGWSSLEPVTISLAWTPQSQTSLHLSNELAFIMANCAGVQPEAQKHQARIGQLLLVVFKREKALE